MSSEPAIVDELISLDRLSRWLLLRRADGLYSYVEDTFHREEPWVGADRSEFDAYPMHYWKPTHVSGLFDTIEAAQHDALDSLPWFFEALINDADSS